MECWSNGVLEKLLFNYTKCNIPKRLVSSTKSICFVKAFEIFLINRINQFQSPILQYSNTPSLQQLVANLKINLKSCIYFVKALVILSHGRFNP